MAKKRRVVNSVVTAKGLNELAQKTETRIVFDQIGTPGLNEWSGFISKAYNHELTWPGVYPLFNRIRRSDPEISQIRLPFMAWSRGMDIKVEIPDDATSAEEEAGEFYESVLEDVEGGQGQFKETLISQVPFMGWGWWDVQPCKRDPSWTPPDQDPWRSEQDDGLVGIRRFAWRDQSTFWGWDMDNKTGFVRGMKQSDPPNPAITLPIDHSLHIVFGDPQNPEGISPLEAVWRLERIKYGLEVIQGIGFEHAAGYFQIDKTEGGTLSADDKANMKAAAKAVLTAQEGNYAYFPAGLTGEVKDIPFAAAPALLEAIKYYGILKLSIFAMQWMALSATTGSGSYASMDDSSTVAVVTFNSMMDGFIGQFDQQIGRRLWEWNKSNWPAETRRPKYIINHIDKKLALSEVGQFLSSINGIVPMGDDDMLAIRARSGFLPEVLPPEEETVEPVTEPEVTGEVPGEEVPPEQTSEEEAPPAEEKMATTPAQLIEAMSQEVEAIKAASLEQPTLWTRIRNLFGAKSEDND